MCGQVIEGPRLNHYLIYSLQFDETEFRLETTGSRGGPVDLPVLAMAGNLTWKPKSEPACVGPLEEEVCLSPQGLHEKSPLLIEDGQ